MILRINLLVVVIGEAQLVLLSPGAVEGEEVGELTHEASRSFVALGVLFEDGRGGVVDGLGSLASTAALAVGLPLLTPGRGR